MRRSRTYAFVALVTLGGLPSGLHAQTGGSIEGTILGRFESQVRPLPFAVVEAWGPGIHRTVVADSAGHYLLADLPAGALRVRVTHPGHDPVQLDVVVPTDAATLVDLELRARPVELPPVDVTTDVRVPDAERRDVAAEAETAGRVEAAALEIGTGAVDAGLADAVRAFGGNDPAQATDVLFMRGSTTDLKLVLLDGAPVFTPFHVAGLLRSFEPSVLGRARDVFQAYSGIIECIDNLELVADALGQRYSGLDIYFDLSELRGYTYHTGIVFAANVGEVGQVARGGRYDHIGEVFGRTGRGATGFSVNIRRLTRQNLTDAEHPEKVVVGEVDAKTAPDLWEHIQKLRSDGYVVAESGTMSDFDYELCHDGNGWHLVSHREN